ncbi:hypothetical protein FSARC_357 [Fusarium sarcochroum]|uniref:Heterokaryon incompatibility domain-containing protein n=1 Tax=Fusarium sarcochroum TaxID=1208366 RepID=A0A8H4UBD8_9HYPO|nr:hypothetical protein FSARC_357 [Fusarium sarcochroum]
MPVSESSSNTGNAPLKFLSVQDGTLCDWCHDGLQRPGSKSEGNPFRTRALSDLLEASSYCKYCAMWAKALRQSERDLKEEGQEAALKKHPLAQDVVEPKDVKLQFLSLHNWDTHNFQLVIAWPHLGPQWAALDFIKADDAKAINTKPLPVSDQDDETWQSVTEWLARCDKYHPFCKHAKDPAWKPSRLLYLSPPSGPLKVRLVEGEDVPDQVEYLTLSHRWGGTNPLQLTRDTLEPFKSSMSVDALSRTFVDACNTVRKLGHAYLWIDSLCIIQNDVEDWALEAGRMSSVYGNSWLNICAAGASTDNDGLFYPEEKRDVDAWLPVWVRREWGGTFSGDYCVSDHHNWWMRVADSPLNRRAWVLQERILAPRVLHFGLEQVALECCSASVCERLPYGDPTTGGGHALMSLTKQFVLGVRNDDLDQLTLEGVFRDWNQVVRGYAQGQLTVETDRLVALAGLVDAFYPVFESMAETDILEDTDEEGDDNKEEPEAGVPDRPGETSDQASGKQPSQSIFLAGLWKPYLWMQLAWRATSRIQRHQMNDNAPAAPGKRYDQYVAPTWSWCSLKDAVIEPQEVRSIDTYFVKVLDVNIKPSPDFDPENSLSGLKYCCAPGSSLRLQCSILPIAGLGIHDGMQFFNLDAMEDSEDSERQTITIESKNFYDVAFQQEAIHSEMPCAVPIFADRTRITEPLHCLILDARKDEQGNRYFVRLGALVILEVGDARRFWNGVEAFDRIDPGQAQRYDDLYRLGPTDRKPHYEKEDGVLQRVIEIR